MQSTRSCYDEIFPSPDWMDDMEPLASKTSMPFGARWWTSAELR